MDEETRDRILVLIASMTCQQMRAQVFGDRDAAKVLEDLRELEGLVLEAEQEWVEEGA